MNTERDNFHDWAKDKPRASSFAGLQGAGRLQPARRSAARNGGAWLARLAMALLVLIALAVAAQILKRYVFQAG